MRRPRRRTVGIVLAGAAVALTGWARYGALPEGLLDLEAQTSIEVVARDGEPLREALSAEGQRSRRIDPDRLPDAPGYDDRVIVMCSQGYASSLAAAILRDLGFTNATDVDGGVTAWTAAGLPLEPCHGATDEESHGRP